MANSLHSRVLKAFSAPTLQYLLICFGFFLLAAWLSPRASAQSGMDYREFSSKLELYYDKAMVEDVRKQLPQDGEFRVWGWDVGDFSGDGNYDVAFTIRMADDKKRQVQVFLFIDVDGYLQNVNTFQYSFVETPLEVGMVIKSNACYVTQKKRQYEWTVRGYRFSQGSISLLDEFVTTRVDHYTREYYRNFQSLKHELKFLQQATGDVNFDLMYVAIPSYARGEQSYRGLNAIADVSTVDYVTKGSFYWSGVDDCSFNVRSAYDEKYLYLTINVRDSLVITSRCDTCPADNIDIWFDTRLAESDVERVFRKKARHLQFRNSSDSNLFCLHLSLGDFKEIAPTIRVSSTDSEKSELKQQLALKQLTQKVALRDQGYVARLRIPFALLGFDVAPIRDKDIAELGCSIVVHDIDNEYRPEEESILATSQVEAMNPSTFGCLLLIPQDTSFGESVNIFADNLVKVLNALGF